MTKEQLIDRHAQTLKSYVGTGLAKDECIGLIKNAVNEALISHGVSTELPTSTQLLSDCKKRFKELEGKGNLDYRSYMNGYLDSFSKNVVSKIK